MDNAENEHINVSTSSRRGVNSSNKNTSAHLSHRSISLKKRSNTLNNLTEENKNKPHSTPPILRRTKQAPKRVNQSHPHTNTNTQTHQIKIKIPTNIGQNLETNENDSQNTSPQISPNPILTPPRQFPIIPRLDFSNLPSFESEPEYQRLIMAPRAISTYRREPQRRTSYIAPSLQFNTPRYEFNAKDLLCDYMISSADKNSNLCCTICLCDFNEGEKTAKLQCGHVFHTNCIIAWLNKGPSVPTCPMCRQHLHKFVLENFK